jgi:hypothetical protein
VISVDVVESESGLLSPFAMEGVSLMLIELDPARSVVSSVFLLLLLDIGGSAGIAITLWFWLLISYTT